MFIPNPTKNPNSDKNAPLSIHSAISNSRICAGVNVSDDTDACQTIALPPNIIKDKSANIIMAGRMYRVTG